MLYRKNLWSRELFGKWRHNRLAKGNAHRVNNAFSDKAAWELSRTHATMPLMNCARVWYRTDQESGNLIGREPGLSFVYLQSLLISLINVCANIYVIWNRKLITAQLSTENTSYFIFFVYLFFILWPPRVSTRGIASRVVICENLNLDTPKSKFPNSKWTPVQCFQSSYHGSHGNLMSFDTNYKIDRRFHLANLLEPIGFNIRYRQIGPQIVRDIFLTYNATRPSPCRFIPV